MRPPAGVTPKGYELYRTFGSDEWTVHVPYRDGYESPTVGDEHKRTPIGRFATFNEAAIYADTEAWR